MTRFQHGFSFVVMTVLVFVLITFFMSAGYSTSANEDLSFGWLQFHRRGPDWSIEHFRFGILVLDVFLAVALTWVLEKMLRQPHGLTPRERRQPAGPTCR
jgi:hypothetical protein